MLKDCAPTRFSVCDEAVLSRGRGSGIRDVPLCTHTSKHSTRREVDVTSALQQRTRHRRSLNGSCANHCTKII